MSEHEGIPVWGGESVAADEVDVGILSRAEQRFARHCSKGETPTDRFLREGLEDRKYEATETRRWFEAKLKEALPRGFPFDLIQSFADWTARETLLREQLERMGWL